MGEEKKGWGQVPGTGQKFHYFTEKKSLCRKVLFFWGDRSELDDRDHNSSLNCAECKRRHKKQFGGEKRPE